MSQDTVNTPQPASSEDRQKEADALSCIDQKPGEERATASRRWGARIFDIWFFGPIAFVAQFGFVLLLGKLMARLPDMPELPEWGDAVVGYAVATIVWVLFFAVCLALESLTYAIFKGTFGRWVFSTLVRDKDGKKVSRKVYWKRTLRVFVTGIFFGLPVLGWIAWIVQAIRVRLGKETTYDQALGLTSRQYKQSKVKFVVAILFIGWIGLQWYGFMKCWDSFFEEIGNTDFEESAPEVQSPGMTEEEIDEVVDIPSEDAEDSSAEPAAPSAQ